MYQIIRYSPTYCPSTDALTGTKARVLPMTYFSPRLARKLAGRLEQADFDACGDDSFGVIPAGERPFPQRAIGFSPSIAESGDLPF